MWVWMVVVVVGHHDNGWREEDLPATTKTAQKPLKLVKAPGLCQYLVPR